MYGVSFSVVVVVAVSTMTHKCNRDNCAPVAVNGPKLKCAKCKTLCYLQCFGFDDGAKIGGLDTVKFTLPSGGVISTFVSTMVFTCCSDTMTTTENKTLKVPSAPRSTSKGRPSKDENESMITSELNMIKEILTSIKSATEANTAEIAEIKSLSTKTEANVKKVTEQSQTPIRNEPRIGTALTYAQAFRANALSKAANATPNSGNKRRRTDYQSGQENVPSNQNVKFPTPKVGTKSVTSGFAVVPKPIRVLEQKPKFEKALVIRRVDPMVTNEQIIDYITTNTTVKDPAKFNVHKMVRKDAVLSELRFVSFKIELNNDDFDVLFDANVWQEGVEVRKFLPKNELGNYFPPLNNRSEQQNQDSTVTAMEDEQITN